MRLLGGVGVGRGVGREGLGGGLESDLGEMGCGGLGEIQSRL